MQTQKNYAVGKSAWQSSTYNTGKRKFQTSSEKFKLEDLSINFELTILFNFVYFLLSLVSKLKWNERDNPYYFFQANQQKPDTKIYSLTQCSLTVNKCDWHILAGNNERIKSHCLTLIVQSIQTFLYISILLTGLEFNCTVRDFLCPWLWFLIDFNVIQNCIKVCSDCVPPTL